MQLRRLLTTLAVLFLSTACVPQSRAECPPGAREVVMQFLRLDFEGYRLGSKGHEAIWQLTDNDGEPPDEPLVVTKNYRIISASRQDVGGCRFRVGFTTYGYISETASGSVIRSKPANEIGTMDVHCTRGSCRISLARADFQLPPHPGTKATAQLLGYLESIQDTAAEKRRYRTLRERIASLR